ncbi:MAG: hypothetical protein WAM28_02650 [Chlamydiales bacterium]
MSLSKKYIMNFLKKIFLFILIALIAWGGIYTYNRATDGFSLYQISSSLPIEAHIASEPLTPEKKQTLKKILDQPFTYLGKGCQFYVFGSEDGEYVIKLLKQKHLRPFSWLNKIPMPKKIRTLSNEKIQRRKSRVKNLFSSCQLAFNEMAEETGLIFIHLNRFPALEQTVTLIDKLERHHTIEIDDHEFVLQKRAITVKDVFLKLQKEEEVRDKIAQLVGLVQARCQKGICDRDRSFVQNVAFCIDGSQAVFVDIGQFYKDDSILQKEKQKEDVKRRLGNLRHWAARHFPDFVCYVDEQIEESK